MGRERIEEQGGKELSDVRTEVLQKEVPQFAGRRICIKRVSGPRRVTRLVLRRLSSTDCMTG